MLSYIISLGLNVTPDGSNNMSHGFNMIPHGSGSFNKIQDRDHEIKICCLT